MEHQETIQHLLNFVQEGNNVPLSEESLSTLYTLAYELYNNGKYEDAKQFFRFLTIGNAFDRRFWIGLAASYQMLKDYQAAIECYSVAAIQEPNDPYIHWYAATCFFNSSQVVKGLQALNSARTVATENNSCSELIPQIDLMQQVWSDPSKSSMEVPHV